MNLSEKMREIRSIFQLSHAKMAEILGVNVQRSVNLSTGNVKSLSEKEVAALVEKLGIDPIWLSTGKGKMLLKDKKTTISTFLKDGRISSYFEVKALAKEIGVSPKDVFDYEEGIRRPTAEYLRKFCEVTDSLFSTATSMFFKDLPSNEQFELIKLFENKNEASLQHGEDYAFIPAHDIWASAGHGAESFDDVPRRRLAFRKRWLALHGYNEKDLCAIFAKGDSMEPTISEWTTLIINRAYKRPIDGKIFIIRQGDNLFVKRLQIQLNGSILLLSDNPAYPPMLLSASDLEQVDIIGQVVHISKDV